MDRNLHRRTRARNVHAFRCMDVGIGLLVRVDIVLSPTDLSTVA
jgi:hypothetical protein